MSETGTVTMDGWAGWANEQLKRADVASDAIKLLASEVAGFMRTGDHVADDEEGDDMRKLRDYMHKKGARSDRP